MLDITLLRKDLDSVVARLQTRKNPQAFLDVAAFTALCADEAAAGLVPEAEYIASVSPPGAPGGTPS